LDLNMNTVKPVYKGHWREPVNVPIMNSCPLYTGSNYIHYLLNGENETALYRQWFFSKHTENIEIYST
jgi:hypothetical protein